MESKNNYLAFFSLLQFCPDILRQESINIGLILWTPDSQPNLFYRSGDQSWDRLKYIWGSRVNEFIVRAQVSSILRGCERDQALIKNHQQLEMLYRYACNEVRLTPFRSIQVDRIAGEVFEVLYHRLVEVVSNAKEMSCTCGRIQTHLDSEKDLVFKQQRDQDCAKALAELVELTESFGGYNEIP